MRAESEAESERRGNLVLCLSRGDTIVLAEGEVVITFVERRHNGDVKLAVSAPLWMRVDRGSVHQRRMNERDQRNGSNA